MTSYPTHVRFLFFPSSAHPVRQKGRGLELSPGLSSGYYLLFTALDTAAYGSKALCARAVDAPKHVRASSSNTHPCLFPSGFAGGIYKTRQQRNRNPCKRKNQSVCVHTRGH
ncbi:unnamed protein product [Ectocarpus sp. 13 AM-2016]